MNWSKYFLPRGVKVKDDLKFRNTVSKVLIRRNHLTNNIERLLQISCWSCEGLLIAVVLCEVKRRESCPMLCYQGGHRGSASHLPYGYLPCLPPPLPQFCLPYTYITEPNLLFWYGFYALVRRPHYLHYWKLRHIGQPVWNPWYMSAEDKNRTLICMIVN